MHEAAGELLKAAKALTEALRVEPRNPDTARRVARCFEGLGKWSYAAESWLLARSIHRERTDLTLGLAEALRQARCHLAALLSYERVLEIEPDHLYGLAGKGETLRMLGRSREALTFFAQALAQEPEHAFALRGRASALNALGRYDEALPLWNQALSVEPSSQFAIAGREECRKKLLEIRRGGALIQPSPDRPLPNGARLMAEQAYDWARALSRDGRTDPAIIVFQAAIHLAPEWPEPRWALAELHQRLGRPDEALQTFRALAEILPEDPEHPEPLAGLRESERESSLPSGEGVNRELARASFDEGRARLQKGLLDSAIVDFTRATRRDPTWEEPWFLIGIAQAQRQHHALAVQAFETCLDLRPDHAEATLHKARSLRQIQRDRESIESFEAFISLAPDDLRGPLGKAAAHHSLGEHRESLELYDRVLARHAENAAALIGRATALNALERYQEALPAWLKATRHCPPSHGLREGLKIARRRSRGGPSTGPRSAATQALNKARKLHNSRQTSSAVEACKEALALDPTFAEAALRLGMIHEQLGALPAAAEAYARCLDIDPTHHQAATNLGEIHRKSQDYERAIQAYDKALLAQPDYLYALAGRAESMRMLGQYRDCLAWFDKALELEPRHTFAIQGKAAALNALSRYGEALPLWALALQINPKSSFARDGKVACENSKRLIEAPPSDEEESVELESETPLLDEQGRDLTALARTGALGPVIGREREIRTVMKTLVRRQKANPLLLGDPGVGKTAVVEGLAIRLVREDVPVRLRGLRLIELSMGTLVAGTKYRGTFEERLKGIVREASEQPGIVLFIDELHTLVGAGRTEGSSLDAANILKPALARGEITVIGATTLPEFRKHVEPDSALERRFQPIHIQEPSPSEALELLRGVRAAYAEHHRVEIDAAALAACVELSARYLPDRRLPDKALDLLDEACADASLEQRPVVTSRLVAEVLSERTGIPANQLTARDRARLNALEQTLSQSVRGQPQAITRLSQAVRLCRAGLRDPRRPQGVFLFVGPTGVGKTELAKQLAAALHPQGDSVIRLDMSEYSERFTLSRLIGAPPGYAGHGEPGQLTDQLRRRPYAVVLLDEFEKAHEEVQALFLSLFDEGHLTDAEGRKIDAKNALFILTSNAGATGSSRGTMGFSSSSGSEVDRIVAQARERFRVELLNRLDAIVPFAPLSGPTLHEIARQHLDALVERAARVGVVFSYSEAVVELCAAHDRSINHGARAVLRAIEALVAEPMSRRLLDESALRSSTLHADLRGGQVELLDRDPPSERPLELA